MAAPSNIVMRLPRLPAARPGWKTPPAAQPTCLPAPQGIHELIESAATPARAHAAADAAARLSVMASAAFTRRCCALRDARVIMRAAEARQQAVRLSQVPRERQGGADVVCFSRARCHMLCAAMAVADAPPPSFSFLRDATGGAQRSARARSRVRGKIASFCPTECNWRNIIA